MPIFDYAELEQRAVEREREEERRILHVAMTRAQRHLILSGVLELEKLWDEPKHGEPLIAPVLRALEWSDGRSPVELEPPPLRPGLDGELAPARVAIRVRRPRDEDAARVGAAEPPARADGADRPSRAEGAEPPARSAGAEPPARVDGAERAVPVRDRPLQDPDLTPLPSPPEAPVRSLSYSALSLYERCGYRFYAERVLGLQPRPPAGPAGPAAGDERHPAGRADGLTSRYGQGRVVHELLEHSARHGWREPGAGLVADLLRREGLEAGHQEVDRIVRLVRGFLEAPIRGVLAAAGRVHPEAPFAFRAGDLVVRGEIDLLADLGDQVVVVDYKSDALGDAAPAEHMGRYEVQRRIYALAALRRYGRPVRVCYVFLERPDDPVEVSFAPEDASRLSREITAMTAAIADGRFEVTSSPERSLCFDCPARARLCVHGPDLTLRDPWPR